jgi:hypothetical protein
MDTLNEDSCFAGSSEELKAEGRLGVRGEATVRLRARQRTIVTPC